MIALKRPFQAPCKPVFFLTALPLLALAGSGCSRSAPESTAIAVQPQLPTNGSKGAVPDERKSPKDESLTSMEYILLGLPAQDRNWSGEDMVNAERILSVQVRKGSRQLPWYKSERSGEFFARMTSPENLKFYRNRSLPITARFPEALDYFEASNRLLKLYLAGFLKNDVRDSELVELMGSQLRMTVVMLELVEEFIPTLKKDDPTYPVRMDGLKKMREGFAEMVAGGLRTLTERESYRAGELVRLVGYMQETYPRIVPQIPPGSRAETLLKLEKAQNDETMKDLQPGLSELYSKVKAALNP